MTRAISSLCLLVALVGGVSTANGDNKKKTEKIAILGLEVFTQGSASVDAESTRVATDLTVALRLRPKAQQGPFLFTPNSEKELIDEKLMNNCENESRDCMAKIGDKLGADQLMYGRIEKKSQAGSAGYQISLKLLGVKSGQFNTWTDFIPLADTAANSSKLGDWARRGYKRLTNENEGGTLVIVTKNVERGTILIDGEERGNITNNRGEVTLNENRYKVAVVATGFHRWTAEEPISIKNGETHTEEIVLREIKPGDPKLCDPALSTCENTGSDEGPKTGIWKGMMVTGLVLAVGGGGFAIYSGLQVNDAEKKLEGLPDGMARQELLDKGEKNEKRANIGWGVTAVGGVLAVVGFIKGYVATGKEKEAAGNPTVGRARKRPASGLVVAPVVTPRGGGATLRFDW
jgi:hypothetical protein